MKSDLGEIKFQQQMMHRYKTLQQGWQEFWGGRQVKRRKVRQIKTHNQKKKRKLATKRGRLNNWLKFRGVTY